MKHEMSAQHQDSITCAIIGLMTGYVQYFKTIPLNVHLFSTEWMVTAVHAGITGAFCGGLGWLGKKVAEVAYNYFTEFIRNRKQKK